MINFEANVIGSLLLDNQAIATVRTILDPGDFQNADYSEIYRCMLELADRNAPCDVLSLADALLNDKYTVSIGFDEIAVLLDHTASAVNVGYYADQVQDQSLKRKVYLISHLADSCESGAEAVEQAIKHLAMFLMMGAY